MRFGKIIPQIGVKDTLELVEETTLSSAVASYTFSNLNGNTDEVYILNFMIVNDQAGLSLYYLRPNGDNGANYGYQYIRGSASTVSAGRGTENNFLLSVNSSQNDLTMGSLLLYAKSGYIRTNIHDRAYNISGTTVTAVDLFGESWNNTSDEITSLVVASNTASGLGVGTYLALYRKKV